MKGSRFVRVAAIGAVLAAVAPGGVASADVNVLTQHNDAARTGANNQEQALTVAAVKKAGKFGKLWTLFADGQIVAQPLYVSNLSVAGKGTFNAVIVATMHNTIYVYDADKKPTQPQSRDALIWAQWLSDPQPENPGFDSWNTNFPEYGILSTPVVDDAHTTLYVVTWHRDGGGQFRLHALDLTKALPPPGSGFPPVGYRDKVRPVVITAQAPNPGGGQLKLDTTQQKQRAALLLSGGVLYVGFATNRETDNSMHGWLLAYDATTLQQRAVWNATPNTHNGGIWQAGSGPAADADGNVYVMTGNGPFDADRGGQSYGDSVVKLKLEAGAMTVKDYFTPCNQTFLDRACTNGGEACDLDLGSAGPMLLPVAGAGAPRLIGGGKDGTTYVLDTASLGHFKAPAAPSMKCVSTHAVQTVLGGKQGGSGVIGNIHGSHVVWTGPAETRVFVWGEDDNLRSFKVTGGKLATPPAKSLYKVPDGMPGGMLSVSSNGTQAGTGILWALVPLAGDANSQRGVRAQLLAFDASNIRTDIWRSEPLDASVGPNSVGLFAKFAPPTIANGKVFVATYGDHENPPGPTNYGGNNKPPPGSIPKNFYLAVYGLRP